MEDESVWMRGNRQRQGGAEAAPLVVDKKPEGWMGGGGRGGKRYIWISFKGARKSTVHKLE